jgi:hypothetical protein
VPRWFIGSVIVDTPELQDLLRLVLGRLEASAAQAIVVKALDFSYRELV